MSHAHQITVSASKHAPSVHKGGGKGKKTLKHMTVTPLANGGATVEHHFMPPDAGMGMPAPSETHGFSSPNKVGNHVKAMLQGMPGAPAAMPGAAPNAAIDGDSGNDAA